MDTLVSAFCSSLCYLSSTRDLLSLYGSLGFSGSVLLQGVPERALSLALQALLCSGRFCLSHALLRCDGDEVLCESASACPTCPPNDFPAAAAGAGAGSGEVEEDRTAPTCPQHARLATHAGVYSAFHRTSPALVRAGNAVRGALCHYQDDAFQRPPEGAPPRLLVLAVERIDLLLSASATCGGEEKEEEEEEEVEEEGVEEAFKAQQRRGESGGPMRIFRALARLEQWARCRGCWAMAGCSAAPSLPPVALLLSAQHPGPCLASGIKLPPRPTATLSPSSLAALLLHIPAPAAGQQHLQPATLSALLPLWAPGGGAGAGPPPAHTPFLTLPHQLCVDGWLAFSTEDALAGPPCHAAAAADDEAAAGGAWGEYCGFEGTKLVLLRRVIAPMWGALASAALLRAQQQQQQQQRGEEGGKAVDLVREQLTRIFRGAAPPLAQEGGAGRSMHEGAHVFALVEQVLQASTSAGASVCGSAPPAASPLLQPPTGVLLMGPSGSGKTLLAQRLASAARASFLHVSCPRLLSRYVGDSEGNIRAVFAAARAASPCLLLLDDVDAIAGKRGGSSILNSLVATLLTEMEGVGLAAQAVAPAVPANGDAPPPPPPPLCSLWPPCAPRCAARQARCWMRP
jgi:hypothetical protein